MFTENIKSIHTYVALTFIIAIQAVSLAPFWTNTAEAAWYDSSYDYCRAITMTAGGNSGGVATTTTSGFPLVATTTIADLKSVTNGGKVQVVTGNKPFDVVFTSGTDCNTDSGTMLDFYFESYASTTGAIVAWVQAPDISSTTAKTVLMYYGNAAATDQQDKAGVWDAQGEVGVYNFDETDIDGGAGDIKDARGVNNGTTSGMNTADQVAGQINGAFDVDGTNDYVDVGANYNFERTDSFTYSTWIKRGTQNTFDAILGKYDTASNYRGMAVVVDSTPPVLGAANALVFDLISDFSGSNRLLCATPANTITVGKWHHIAITYSGGSVAASVKAYVDDVPKTLSCTGTLSGTIQNSKNLRIGDDYDGDFFSGIIDDVRIYSKSLHAMDVRTIYNNTANSAAFWTFGTEETESTSANGYGVMSSGSYSITSDSINFGGGRSTSDSFRLEDTAGEIATGDSASDSFVLRAGYQQMGAVSISATPASDVVMSPALGGLTGGTSDGSTTFEVSTDNPAGYSVTIVASGTPALQSADDSFADYVPAGAAPDFTFTNAATASSFAFSPEGNDIVQRYMDDGASCNTGSGDTGTSCWDGLSTTPKTIVSRTSANHPAGTETTVRFRAAIGSSRVQTNGTYVATTTVTILPL